jgi:hypothetical protein
LADVILWINKASLVLYIARTYACTCMYIAVTECAHSVPRSLEAILRYQVFVYD